MHTPPLLIFPGNHFPVIILNYQGKFLKGILHHAHEHCNMLAMKKFWHNYDLSGYLTSNGKDKIW